MKKGLIAPLIITILFVLYIIGYFLLFAFIPDFPLIAKIIMGVLILPFAGVIIAMFVERYKELKGGEYDDISKY